MLREGGFSEETCNGDLIGESLAGEICVVYAAPFLLMTSESLWSCICVPTLY